MLPHHCLTGKSPAPHRRSVTTARRKASGHRETRKHELDRDNRELLQAGRLSTVLCHDLRRDMHRACQIIMQAHDALDGPIVTAPAPIQVITPFNIPPDTPA